LAAEAARRINNEIFAIERDGSNGSRLSSGIPFAGARWHPATRTNGLIAVETR
jgi:hypothetical protein